MRAEKIKDKADSLKARYHTDKLQELCQEMHITVMEAPMGAAERSCKGFFIQHSRQKVIVLNAEMPEHIKRIILAHELGHAVLHSNEGISAFHDCVVLSGSNPQELEANVFAAEFLIDDNMVLESIKEGRDFYTMASELCVPPEMLDFKLRIMQKQGHPIVAPYIAKSDFLKRDLEKVLN